MTCVLALGCVAVAACASDHSVRPLDRAAAMALAQGLHEELNRLEVGGLIEEQTRYFAEDMMRLDPYRIPSRGREASLADARAARDMGYVAEAVTTRVLDAWIEGDRMVEYGTTTLKFSIGGTAAVESPVSYLAVWRIDITRPMDARIETLIWNPQTPTNEFDSLVNE